MKPHVQAVVIGGGVVGCSVLFHLTKLGWKDCVLLERSELTSGSTWHAAGGMHTVNGDPNVAQLQQYTIKLYEEIQEISGQEIGLHLTGGVMLAGTQDRFDWLQSLHAKGRYLGMETEVISAEEAAKIMPLMIRNTLSELSTIPSKGISILLEQPGPMPKPPRNKAVKFINKPELKPCTRTKTAPGMFIPTREISMRNMLSTPEVCGPVK